MGSENGVSKGMYPKATMLNETGERIADALEQANVNARGGYDSRVSSLNGTSLRDGSKIVEAVGLPVYVSENELAQYTDYDLDQIGWYIFARIKAPSDAIVGGDTTVEGAKFKMEIGNDYIDVAVRFDAAALSQAVAINWGDASEVIVFRAHDLGIRNLDYRVTFYVYDLAPYTTWEYALTTDTTFAADKRYYTESDGAYSLAEVTAGEAVPAYYTIADQVYTQATGVFEDGVTYYTLADGVYTLAEVTVGDQIPEDPAYYTLTNVVYTQATGTFVEGVTYYTKNENVYSEATVTVGDAIPAYYNHSKVTFSGMNRNITYQLDEIIDCPQEYVLPEIEDDGHGTWYEFRLQHSGSFSSTLIVPEGVKIATEHTQAETAGMNMVDLHYMSINGTKIWRFMNTHSSIPA